MQIGDKVRLGGINGTIIGHRLDDDGNDLWIVDLAGVSCECDTREIQNRLPPHDWEVACGRDY